MAPALSDLQPQSAPKATAAAQTAIGDGLVKEAQAFAGELAAWRTISIRRPNLVTTSRRPLRISRHVWTRWTFRIPRSSMVPALLPDRCRCRAAQGNGVYADEQAGTVIMLRGDMDALPVVEESGQPFASTNGCMHVCGHDMHATALLGAARLLKAGESSLWRPTPQLSCCSSRARKPLRGTCRHRRRFAPEPHAPPPPLPCMSIASRRLVLVLMGVRRFRACTVSASRCRARAAMVRAPRFASTPSRPACMCTWRFRRLISREVPAEEVALPWVSLPVVWRPTSSPTLRARRNVARL